ncbi:MAG: hypothetical protein ACLFQK_03495 [Fibrobacterota bacterium]
MNFGISGRVVLFAAVFAYLCGCGPKPHFSQDGTTYINRDFKCSLSLPGIKGWTYVYPDYTKDDRPDDIIFEAEHYGRLINVFLTAQKINSGLEDFLILIKMSENLTESSSFREEETVRINVNGVEGIRYIYSAQSEDPGGDGSRYIFINNLFKYREFNYNLIVATLYNEYGRKKELMDKIADGFGVLRNTGE